MLQTGHVNTPIEILPSPWGNYPSALLTGISEDVYGGFDLLQKAFTIKGLQVL